MRGVAVFKHVYMHTLESLRNYYKSIYIYLAVWHDKFDFLSTYDIWYINCHFHNREKYFWCQTSQGSAMCGKIICKYFAENLTLFPTVKEFWK